VQWTPGTPPIDLPVAESRRPYRTHLGRDASGGLVAAYVRCTSTCAPFIWDFAAGRELPLTRDVPRPCVIHDFALWGETFAYVCRGGGLWLRRGAQPARLLTPHPGSQPQSSALVDLRGEDILWRDSAMYSFDTMLTRVSGRTRRIDQEDAVTFEESGETFSATLGDDGEVYELVAYHYEGSALFRMLHCQAWRSNVGFLDGIGFPYDVAVDGGRMLYSTWSGVWLADPARVRFEDTRTCGIT